MGESKRGVTREEVHSIVDTRLIQAVNEVAELIAVVMPELVRAAGADAATRQKYAESLRSLAEQAYREGRIAAAAAANQLAAGIDATA